MNVLFLCTGNSARSILAEMLLNLRGAGRFRAYSAGSRPKGEVHPLAIRTLREAGVRARGARSKSWDEFGGPDAPSMDFVITVCGNAANETCPTWPGHPATAHWGVDDPAAVEGPEEERRRAFRRAYDELDARVRMLVELPLESLDRRTAEAEVRRIAERAAGPAS